MKPPIPLVVLLMLFALPFMGRAQTREINLTQATQIALNNNFGLKASLQRVDQSRQLIGSAIDIEKTKVYYNKDENNIAPNNRPFNVWGISQSLQFPTVYSARRKVMQGKTLLSEGQYTLDVRLVAKEVSKAYYEVVYNRQLLNQYTYLDSLYTDFAHAANRRFEQGASNYLEKLTAETKQKEIAIQLNQVKRNGQKSYIKLQQWLQTDTTYTVKDEHLIRLQFKPLDTVSHPGINYYSVAVKLSQQQLVLEKQKLFPMLNFSFFQGSSNGTTTRYYNGFQAGIAIPIWFYGQKSKINAAKTGISIMKAEAANYTFQLKAKYLALLSDIKQFEEALNYYDTTGKELSEKLLFHAVKAFQQGEIDFLLYTQLLENAKSIELNYLSSLFQYNKTVLEANYVTN